MNFVIIAAAGNSNRMMGINKILYPICQKPSIYWTIKAFEDTKDIENIIVMANAKDLQSVRNLIKQFNFLKVKAVVEGGKDRQESVWLGIREAEQLGFSDQDIFIMHDGARPLIKQNEIIKSINTANQFVASVIAVRAKDTIKQVDNRNNVVKTLDRDYIWLMQTPQAAKFQIIRDVFRKALKDNFFATDVAGLLEHYGYQVKIIEGDYKNIKITTPEDLDVVETFLKQNKYDK